MNTIGEIIKKRRQELGLTLEDVGKAVGVGKSTVKKWEDGYISNMRRDKIALIAKVLNLDPITLVTGESKTAPAKADAVPAELIELLRQLPDEAYPELLQFAQYLRSKYPK